MKFALRFKQIFNFRISSFFWLQSRSEPKRFLCGSSVSVGAAYGLGCQPRKICRDVIWMLRWAFRVWAERRASCQDQCGLAVPMGLATHGFSSPSPNTARLFENRLRAYAISMVFPSSPVFCEGSSGHQLFSIQRLFISYVEYKG